MKVLKMTPENDKLLGKVFELANIGARHNAAENATKQLQVIVDTLNTSMEEHNDKHSETQATT